MNIHRQDHSKPSENLRLAYYKLDDVREKLDSLHLFLSELNAPGDSIHGQIANLLDPIIGLMDEPLNFIDEQSKKIKS